MESEVAMVVLVDGPEMLSPCPSRLLGVDEEG